MPVPSLSRTSHHLAFGPLHLAHALRKLDRTKEARDALLPVADKFPDEWRIPYRLACCYSQLRRFEGAEAWFKRARAADEDTNCCDMLSV